MPCREPVDARTPSPWHFTYQPQFIQAYGEDKTHDAVSYLYNWATARIAYRHELVSNTPRDVESQAFVPKRARGGGGHVLNKPS
ncbi:hypothetical protein Ct61P_14539 [Colletotrichum tofieldiae]|nr:hypothetical protein Ct61P_14539 [Colletotrichum tofieldiae]